MAFCCHRHLLVQRERKPPGDSSPLEKGVTSPKLPCSRRKLEEVKIAICECAGVFQRMLPPSRDFDRRLCREAAYGTKRGDLSRKAFHTGGTMSIIPLTGRSRTIPIIGLSFPYGIKKIVGKEEFFPEAP
jgi:hypothetical protein